MNYLIETPRLLLREFLLEYGFTKLQLKEIIAQVLKANFASVRVLEKLGFSHWKPIDFGGEAGMQGIIKNPYF